MLATTACKRISNPSKGNYRSIRTVWKTSKFYERSIYSQAQSLFEDIFSKYYCVFYKCVERSIV